MTVLSPDSQTKINHWLQKYPPDQKQSAVMAALSIVQDENGGWLQTEHMDAIAVYLAMPKIAVYEVASFYSMYELKPVGKHKICVCTNISCLLRGCQTIVDHLEKRLKIKMGQTTPDGQVTLKAVECLAACGVAPVMQIGRQYHDSLTIHKIDHILESLE